MPQVTVFIAGRSYRMACDPGEEERLLALAARLDLKMAEMRVRFGEIGDQRITVMAALTLADEAGEAERRAGALASEVEALRGTEADAAAAGERVAAALDDVARRIARVADQLDSNG